MAYTKQPWVDHTTPADAAHMNHIEDGIAAADAKPNYNGDFVPATAYSDGDIVVYNGIPYLCVRPTTAAPNWPVVPALAYGTTLPAAPVDGQEAILTDSLTNPSYQWRFRYNAGSASPYKWEFIGGAPWTVYVGADESVTAGGFTDLTTDGPGVAIPRAGDYDVEAQCEGYHTTNPGDISLGLFVAGANVLNGNHTMVSSMASTWSFAHRATGVAASAVIKLRYNNGTSGTAHFRNRRIRVFPVRVA